MPERRAARAGDETTWKSAVWHDLVMRRVESLPDWLRAVRSGSWLGAGRVRGYAAMLLAFELAAFAFFAAGTHGWIVPLPHPVASDFVSFYAAGELANSGTAALAYDRAAHFAAEQVAVAPGIPYNYFYYPPVFLLLCATVAWLPYLPAFLLFQAAQLVPCLLLVRGILGGGVVRPIPLWMLLTFPPVFWSLGLGQNALLTAALLAGATLAIDRRPVLAGLLFGALCFKPHFGLLIPVALVAGGHWRAFVAAAASAVGLVLASWVLFGWGSWQAFLTAAAGAGSVYAQQGALDLAGLTSPFGLTLALGGARAAAMAVQAVAVVVTAGAVGWVWRRGLPLPVRAAVLLAAIPIAVPIVMFYDLLLSGVAVAWLVRGGWERGFPPWQASTFPVLFALALLAGNIGPVQLLMPPVTAALAFALALRQAWHDRGEVAAATLRLVVGDAVPMRLARMQSGP